jgi:hypothetical protein
MANLLSNTSFSDTGFLRLPIGTSAQRTGSVGAMRLNSTTGLMETFDGVAWDSNVIAFPYRSIITTAFTQGGYKDAVAWNNINKTFTSTDTTVNLGDVTERSHNYQWGACSKDYSYVFGAGGGHAVASNYTTAFNMRTEQQVSDITRTLAGTRHTFGGVFQEHYYAWMSGGDATRIEEYNLTTKTLVGTLAPTYASGAIWGISHENIGIFYTSESASTWTFATRTIAARGGTAPSAHHQQKSIQSKHSFAYCGNQGTYNGGNNLRRTNMVTNVTTVPGLNKIVQNSGEENLTLGNDHQYMLGMYNGLQNNISWRFNYATESGFTGATSMEPKGKAGMSSAVCGWCD